MPKTEKRPVARGASPRVRTHAERLELRRMMYACRIEDERRRTYIAALRTAEYTVDSECEADALCERLRRDPKIFRETLVCVKVPGDPARILASWHSAEMG